MSEPGLRELEIEVEAARARLEGDLTMLRSPATVSEFTDDLRLDALEARDALVEQARSGIENLVETVKAKAAANPAATLLIGAGIAWQLVRRPPIATALVGAGLYGLLRATPRPAGTDTDYLSQARTRLREQAEAVGTEVKARVVEAGEVVKERAEGLASSAGEKARDWQTEAKAALNEAVTANDRAGGDRWAGRRPVVHESRDGSTGNSLFLGFASLAVSAAVGVAVSRRLTD